MFLIPDESKDKFVHFHILGPGPLDWRTIMHYNVGPATFQQPCYIWWCWKIAGTTFYHMVVCQSRVHASNLFLKFNETRISECNNGNPWHWNRTADKLVLSQCVIRWLFIFEISIYTDLGGRCENQMKQFRGLIGAVLQTPLSLIDLSINWVTDSLWKYLQNTLTPKT